jgi:hypothetical protein
LLKIFKQLTFYNKMSRILDTMFMKRFCLPSNVDISSYESGESKISSCLCGNFNHVACILEGKDR